METTRGQEGKFQRKQTVTFYHLRGRSLLCKTLMLHSETRLKYKSEEINFACVMLAKPRFFETLTKVSLTISDVSLFLLRKCIDTSVKSFTAESLMTCDHVKIQKCLLRYKLINSISGTANSDFYGLSTIRIMCCHRMIFRQKGTDVHFECYNSNPIAEIKNCKNSLGFVAPKKLMPF